MFVIFLIFRVVVILIILAFVGGVVLWCRRRKPQVDDAPAAEAGTADSGGEKVPVEKTQTTSKPTEKTQTEREDESLASTPSNKLPSKQSASEGSANTVLNSQAVPSELNEENFPYPGEKSEKAKSGKISKFFLI